MPWLIGLATALGHAGEQAGPVAEEALALTREGGYRLLETRAEVVAATVR